MDQFYCTECGGVWNNTAQFDVHHERYHDMKPTPDESKPIDTKKPLTLREAIESGKEFREIGVSSWNDLDDSGAWSRRQILADYELKPDEPPKPFEYWINKYDGFETPSSAYETKEAAISAWRYEHLGRTILMREVVQND